MSRIVHIFAGIFCILGLSLNLFVIWSALRCLKKDTNKPGFATIANLAAVDAFAALWFLLGQSFDFINKQNVNFH